MMKIVLLCMLAAVLPAQQKLTPVDDAGYTKLVAAHRGKVVMMDFWATWCKPCRAEMPELVKLSQKLRARGFELITVSADEPSKEGAALTV